MKSYKIITHGKNDDGTEAYATSGPSMDMVPYCHEGGTPDGKLQECPRMDPCLEGFMLKEIFRGLVEEGEAEELEAPQAEETAPEVETEEADGPSVSIEVEREVNDDV